MDNYKDCDYCDYCGKKYPERVCNQCDKYICVKCLGDEIYLCDSCGCGYTLYYPLCEELAYENRCLPGCNKGR